MSKEIKLVTPIGTAKYCYIKEPYTSKRGGAPKYKIDLLLDPEIEEHKKFLGKLKNMATNLGVESYPASRDMKKDASGSKVATGLFAVKMHSLYPPNTFDSLSNKIEPNIGNGSKVRCVATVKTYDAFAGNPSGFTLYLQGVQVKELRPVGDASAADMGFDVIEDGYVDEGMDGMQDFNEPEDVNAGEPEDFNPDEVPF
ncbi:MAG: hypothetical protein EOM12_03495 [Verrucomicrobiae bacterium]|nr:hypothetical protein [Verrucomicrobiae bacterium]